MLQIMAQAAYHPRHNDRLRSIICRRHLRDHLRRRRMVPRRRGAQRE
jgi:hypothetical protein